jgi:hypothetical protein
MGFGLSMGITSIVCRTPSLLCWTLSFSKETIHVNNATIFRNCITLSGMNVLTFVMW